MFFQIFFWAQFRIVSSVTPRDAALTQLFRYYHMKEFFAEEETQEALSAVESAANVVECVQFLPVVVQALLRLMCSRSNGARPMETLLVLLARLSKELGSLQRQRQGLLQCLVEWGFDGLADDAVVKMSLHHALCANFLVVLMLRAKSNAGLDEVFALSWWVFDMTVRSLAMERAELGADFVRAGYPSVDFLRLCSKLVAACARTACRAAAAVGPRDPMFVLQFNANVGVFLGDLLEHVDRGHAIDAFCAYVEEMMAEQQQQQSVPLVGLMKYDAIRIVMEHEQWLAWNFPVRLRSGPKLMATHVMSTCVCQAIVTDVTRALNGTGSVASAMYGVHVLLCTMTGRPRTAQTVQIYTPLLLLLVKQWAEWSVPLSATVLGLRRALYLAVLWIVEGTSPSAMKKLWTGMDMVAFWALMEDLLVAFEWTPKGTLDAMPFETSARTMLTPATVPTAASGDFGRVCAHATLTVLDLVELYARSGLGHAGHLLVRMLSLEQGARVLGCIFDSVHSYVRANRRLMWTTDQAFAQGLVRETMRLCNSTRRVVRCEAVVLLYLVLRTNTAELGNFERSNVLATTAVASLVADGHIKGGGTRFRKCMQVLMTYGMVEFEQAPERRMAESSSSRAEYARAVQGFEQRLVFCSFFTFPSSHGEGTHSGT